MAGVRYHDRYHTGFSILVAQFYGAREKENLKCAVAKSYIMTALLSVIVLAVSEGAVYHVLLFYRHRIMSLT